jgi:DNA-nicking Smr family endonuclease
MSRKKRTLNARERALWAEVVKSAAPMHRAAPPPEELAQTATPPAPASPEAPPSPPPLEVFRIGERTSAQSAVVPPGREPHLRMDRRTFAQLKRGKTKPEARIDLHGMTAANAHSALTGFLLRAHAEGRRLVLVITGKGDPEGGGLYPEARGVLRRQVPHWLDLPPLGPIILQVTEAHQRHGGSGAFYVYLRRR